MKNPGMVGAGLGLILLLAFIILWNRSAGLYLSGAVLLGLVIYHTQRGTGWKL